MPTLHSSVHSLPVTKGKLPLDTGWELPLALPQNAVAPSSGTGFAPTAADGLPAEAAVLFRRPPPRSQPPARFRRPGSLGPERAAHTHRNKQRRAAARARSLPTPASRPPPRKTRPTLPPAPRVTCRARAPRRRSPEDARSPRSLGAAGLGAGRWARLSRVSRLPSCAGLGRAGAARLAGVGEGGGARPGRGSGTGRRGVTGWRRASSPSASLSSRGEGGRLS